MEDVNKNVAIQLDPTTANVNQGSSAMVMGNVKTLMNVSSTMVDVSTSVTTNMADSPANVLPTSVYIPTAAHAYSPMRLLLVHVKEIMAGVNMSV
jgi:uncharacterized membrane protein YecN with MAPEG domain